MRYASPQAMEEAFGLPQLVQLTGRGSGQLDADVLERALLDADGLVDSYLTQRYRLPLAGYSFPARLACDIALYYLMGTRVTDSAQTRYEDAVAFLRDVARGVAGLPLDGSVMPAEGDRQGADLVEFQTAGRVFQRGVRGFEHG